MEKIVKWIINVVRSIVISVLMLVLKFLKGTYDLLDQSFGTAIYRPPLEHESKDMSPKDLIGLLRSRVIIAWKLKLQKIGQLFWAWIRRIGKMPDDLLEDAYQNLHDPDYDPTSSRGIVTKRIKRQWRALWNKKSKPDIALSNMVREQNKLDSDDTQEEQSVFPEHLSHP